MRRHNNLLPETHTVSQKLPTPVLAGAIGMLSLYLLSAAGSCGVLNIVQPGF